MDELYDIKAGRVVPVVQAVMNCRAGGDPHDYDCPDLTCGVPALLASFGPTNQREPYGTTCKVAACHSARCSCTGTGATNPLGCHVDGCEYAEPSASGTRRGGKSVPAANLTLQAPTEIHVPGHSGGGGGPSTHRIRIESGRFTLYKLVTFLEFWARYAPADVARTVLQFDGKVLTIPRWFVRPMDMSVTSDVRMNEVQEQRYIYFGFAKFRDIDATRGKVRVQFNRHVDWNGTGRPLSLFTDESQFNLTRKRQRFARMVQEIKASPTPDRCYAFVLGSVNPDRDRSGRFLNLDLGRGLEEVLLFPAKDASRWLDFERVYKRVNGVP